MVQSPGTGLRHPVRGAPGRAVAGYYRRLALCFVTEVIVKISPLMRACGTARSYPFVNGNEIDTPVGGDDVSCF